MSSGFKRGGFAPRNERRTSKVYLKRSIAALDLAKNPLGELVTVISQSNLKPTPVSSTESSAIENCHHVASYSWIDAKSPTILTPGKPPAWTPLSQPQQLHVDNGQYFRDPNAARFPSYPSEPAVRAIFEANPYFPAEDIDIFACGNTMGNLLRFARSDPKPFRFNVEVIGNTVFFVRRENDPRETIEGVRGYGHTFPEAYTTWEKEVQGSESHQRICQYDFGDFKCLVRFECDGYLPERPQDIKKPSTSTQPEPSVNELLSRFNKIHTSQHLSDTSDKLTIKSRGSPVAQHAVFDLKTRSGRYKKEIDMDDIYPQLWVKRIPNFIIAYHNGAGTFKDIRVENVEGGMQEWEKRNKENIRRFETLLSIITETAKQNEGTLLEVCCLSTDPNTILEVRQQYGSGTHALPPSLLNKWSASPDSNATASKDYTHDGDLLPESDDYTGYLKDDSDEDVDFTACSADGCGYCGKCHH